MIRIDALWLAARRLNNGKFVWPREDEAAAAAPSARLSREQFDALVLGQP